MTSLPAVFALALIGFVSSTSILHSVTTSTLSYLQFTTSGRSFCATTLLYIAW